VRGKSNSSRDRGAGSQTKAGRRLGSVLALFLAAAGCAGLINEDFKGYATGCPDAQGAKIERCTSEETGSPGAASGGGAAGNHDARGNDGGSPSNGAIALGGAGSGGEGSDGPGSEAGRSGDTGTGASGPVRDLPHAFLGPLWENQIIGICWLEQRQESELATRVEQLVRDSWGRVSGLRVVSSTSCPVQPAGWITISFNESAVGTIDGIGADPVARHIEVGLDIPNFDAAIVHLFGHALGFDHPRQLGDADVSNSICDRAEPGAEPSSFWERSIMSRDGYCGSSSSDLRGWDVAAIQRAYGRKGRGALVSVGNLCLDIPNDLPAVHTVLQIYSCNYSRNQIWQVTSESQLLVGYVPGLAVDVAYGSWTPFIQLYARSQPVDSNQLFTFQGELRGLGDACLARRLPETEGEALSLEPCSGSDRQRFELAPWGALRNADACLAIDATSPGSAASPSFIPCGDEPPQSFTLTRNAQISAAGVCLEVADARSPNERRVMARSCLAKSAPELPGQQFYFRGKVLSEGKCLHLAPRVPVLHASLEMADCSDQDPSQLWDYHFNDQQQPAPAH
jgi:hypothetical protein